MVFGENPKIWLILYLKQLDENFMKKDFLQFYDNADEVITDYMFREFSEATERRRESLRGPKDPRRSLNVFVIFQRLWSW